MNGGNKTAVTVIIVSFNTVDLLQRTLVALSASTVTPREIIVVDNASIDGSGTMVKKNFPDVILIENKENVGFAKANNQGVRRSTTPFVWLLNSDTETAPPVLEELLNFMETHPSVGACGPMLVYPDGKWQSVGGYFPRPLNVFLYLFPIWYFLPSSIKRKFHSLALYPQQIPSDGKEVEYVTGAALLLRRAALEEVGFLSEDYFMYFEETDLCWRLRARGWKCVVAPTTPLMHVYGGSFRGKYRPERLALFLKSLILFVNKHYSGFVRYIILAEIKFGGRLSIWLKQFREKV